MLICGIANSDANRRFFESKWSDPAGGAYSTPQTLASWTGDVREREGEAKRNKGRQGFI